MMLLGFFLGTAPDTVDWLVWQLCKIPWIMKYTGVYPRWDRIYHWWHHHPVALFISALLVAPLPHVLSDKSVHPPILAHKGDDPKMDEIVWHWPFGINLSRHDIMWLQGEKAQFYFTIFFALSFLIA